MRYDREPMTRDKAARPAALGALLMGLLSWLTFRQVVWQTKLYELDLGSIQFPAPRYASFMLAYVVLGGAGALLIAAGLTGTPRLNRALGARMPSAMRPPPAVVIALFAIAGIAVAAAVRAWVLGGAQITDDEDAYRFMARVIASGHLSSPSPPDPIFHDRAFMVNDGQRFAQYFLGWPALMALGVPFGLAGHVNALLFGLTFAPLYLVARELVGERWAVGACVLFLLAPMTFCAAATELSHTSCIFALAWAHLCFLRSRRPRAPLAWHAGFSVAFCLAFFIRPLSALGIALPLLVLWAVSAARQKRIGPVLAFTFPSLAGAALFLAVNAAQTGDPFKPAYLYLREFAAANHYIFSHIPAFLRQGEVTSMSFARLDEWLSWTGAALLRLNVALYGWPSSFALLPFALGTRAARHVWAILICFLALHLPVSDSGIDAFGPVHYSEVAWPITLLSALGLRAGAVRLRLIGRRAMRSEALAVLPLALAVAMALASLLLYLPVRLGALAAIAGDVLVPRQVVAAAGVGRAVVFSPRIYAPHCTRTPSGEWVPQHHRFWRPLNSPDLSDEVLWVNHLSIERDRAFMDDFPDRTGYVLVWTDDCRAKLRRLDEVRPGEIGNGLVRQEVRPDGSIVGQVFREPPRAPGEPLPEIDHPATRARHGRENPP